MPEKERSSAGSEGKPHVPYHINLGDLECPRCKKTFTVSYWDRDELIQARCLSCDLKWPLPDVV